MCSSFEKLNIENEKLFHCTRSFNERDNEAKENSIQNYQRYKYWDDYYLKYIVNMVRERKRNLIEFEKINVFKAFWKDIFVLLFTWKITLTSKWICNSHWCYCRSVDILWIFYGNHRHGKRIGCSVHVCVSMFGKEMERRKGVMKFSMCTICVRLNLSVSPYFFASYLFSTFSFALCRLFFRWVFEFVFVAVTFFIRQMQNACFWRCRAAVQTDILAIFTPNTVFAFVSNSLFVWFSLCYSLVSRLHKIKIINHRKICKFIISLVTSISCLKMENSFDGK